MTCQAAVFTQPTRSNPLSVSHIPSTYVYGNNGPVVFTDPSGLRGGVAGKVKNPVSVPLPMPVPI